MPSKGTLILVLVIVLFIGGFGWAIVDSLTGETTPTPTTQPNSILQEFGTQTPTTLSTMPPEAASTPVTLQDLQKHEKKQYDCRKINNPSQKDYDPSYPTLINAFRAIESAGNPVQFEPGPYLFIEYGQQPLLKQTRSEMELVHNQDRVCVAYP